MANIAEVCGAERKKVLGFAHILPAMLKAYFDEAGTHRQSDIVMISGVVATPDVWHAFEPAWMETLSNLHLPYFHASECQGGRGIYARLERGTREALFLGLAQVIAQFRPLIVNGSVLRIHWNEYKDRWVGLKYLDPYNICFEVCMRQIHEFAKDVLNGEAIELIFAEQEEYQSKARDIYEYYRSNPQWAATNSSLAFAQSRQVPALQVADLLLYEMVKCWRALQTDPNPTLSPAFRLLNDAGLSIRGSLCGL